MICKNCGAELIYVGNDCYWCPNCGKIEVIEDVQSYNSGEFDVADIQKWGYGIFPKV